MRLATTLDVSAGKFDFNPRTREGCDDYCRKESKWLIQFQSTHPRRVRLDLKFSSKSQEFISIHAPAKGATKKQVDKHNSVIISIHAPAKGATTFPHVFGSSTLFQSTHPRRVRRMLHGLLANQSFISIHAPAKGATAV